MSYCPKCKVILAPGTEICPLCLSRSLESPEGKVPGQDSSPERIFDEAVDGSISPGQRRIMTVELLSVSFGIILAVCVAVDLVFFHSLTWSSFVFLTLAALWLSISMPLVLWKHPALVAAVLVPSLTAVPFLWGVFAGNLTWYLPVGLPITITLMAAIVTSYVLIAIQKKKGLNTIGIVLVAVGVVCAGIDAALTNYFRASIALTWSSVVILSVIPVAGLFFYLHYRVMRKTTLRKLFRL